MIWIRLRDKKELLFVLIVSLIFALFNILHVIIPFFQKPPNTIFIGITHWYEDYFFYLSQLTAGARGAWLSTNAFTTESIPPSLNWSFNLMLGKLGGLLHLTPWVTYDLAVFLLSFLSILTFYVALRRIYPTLTSLRLGGFLLALTANSFYQIKIADGRVQIIPYDYFYNYTASLNRLGGVAHLIAQNILSLLLILLVSEILTTVMKKGRAPVSYLARRILLIAAVTAALFIINPVYVFVDGVVLVLASVWFFTVRSTRKTHLAIAGILIGIATPTIPLYFYTTHIFSHPYYQYFRQWEASIPPTTFSNFIMATGILSLLVPIGLIPFLRKATPLRIIGTLWALIPIAIYFSPLPKILAIPSFRVLQPPVYVILAAIGVQGIAMLSSFLSSIVRQKSSQRMFLILLTAIILMQLPVVSMEINHRLSDPILTSPLNYVDRDILNGLEYLATLPNNEATLATNTLELLVPVISGRRVYSGHRSLTYHYDTKVQHVYALYGYGFTQQEARQFLKKNSIDYILWQKDLGDPQRMQTHYPFLKKLWNNDALTIFTYEL